MFEVKVSRHFECSWCKSKFEGGESVDRHIDISHPYLITTPHGTKSRRCGASAEEAARKAGGLSLGLKLQVQNMHTKEMEVFWVQAQLHKAGDD